MPVACYRRKRSQLNPRNGDFEHLYLTFATAYKMIACYEMNELKAQKDWRSKCNDTVLAQMKFIAAKTFVIPTGENFIALVTFSRRDITNQSTWL